MSRELRESGANLVFVILGLCLLSFGFGYLFGAR